MAPSTKGDDMTFSVKNSSMGEVIGATLCCGTREDSSPKLSVLVVILFIVATVIHLLQAKCAAVMCKSKTSERNNSHLNAEGHVQTSLWLMPVKRSHLTLKSALYFLPLTMPRRVGVCLSLKLSVTS